VLAHNNDQDGLESEPLTPQDWGLPAKPSIVEQRTWDNQQRYLRRFAERGKAVLSAADVGVSHDAVENWQKTDKFGFVKRYELAFQAYRETQEQLNEEWMAETKHNSQIYRIFHMKSIWPEKYREDARPQQEDASQQLLDRLTEMARKDLEKRRQLEAEASEGEYREL
jgi:hypothetical protein